jgi:formylglycine-generating enzyme required for sulfatase activity
MKEWAMARVPILAAAIISVAAHAQRSDTTDPLVQPNLETELAELKAKTAAVVPPLLGLPLSSSERLAAGLNLARAGRRHRIQGLASCPHMMIVPAGEFTMARRPPSSKRSAAPRHHRGAICGQQVRDHLDDWNACASDGGCDNARPNDEGWGRGRHPVIHMSFDLAKTM